MISVARDISEIMHILLIRNLAGTNFEFGYFVEFYFRKFKMQIWKKGIKARDSSILSFIFFLKKSKLFKISR